MSGGTFVIASSTLHMVGKEDNSLLGNKPDIIQNDPVSSTAGTLSLSVNTFSIPDCCVSPNLVEQYPKHFAFN